MKITFLGTRGGITARSPLHYYHTSTLISFRSTHLLFDWGEDWLHKPFPKSVDGLFLTHAHPDHVGGLKNDVPCPVYAAATTWHHIPRTFTVTEKRHIEPEKTIKIGPIQITAFTVQHSLHAPAVGYRIIAGKRTVFYVTDLVAIDNAKALENCDLYIGDGAIIKRDMLVRKKDHTLVGHASIAQQVAWCAAAGIPRAIFTHCGSEITKGSVDTTVEKMMQLRRDYGVHVAIAYDGLTITL